MGRLRADFVDRVEAFVHQMLDIVNLLEARGTRPRLLDQIAAAATSVGANVCEADEGMSRADFVKCLSIASKELSETRFWLRLSARRNWIPQDSATLVLAESLELQRILGSIIRRSKLPRETPKPTATKVPTANRTPPESHQPQGR
jgi:four helix bundle protein